MKKQLLLMGFAATLLLASCSQESDTNGVTYSDVEIRPMSLLPQVEVEQDSGVATRAIADPADELTLQIARADETALGSNSFSSYGAGFEYKRAAGTGAQPLTSLGTPQKYLTSLVKSKLTGWYPIADNYSNGLVSWTIDGTQDILTASAKTGSAIQAMGDLDFKHRLAQLQFRFLAANVKAQRAWGAIIAISVLDQPTVCHYRPVSDDDTGIVNFTVTPTADLEAKNITSDLVSTTTPTLMSDPLMIAPRSSATVLTLLIESAKGKKAKVSIDPYTYLAGKAYNINLLLLDTKVSGSATVGKWASPKELAEQPTVPDKELYLSKDGKANCYIITENNVIDYSFDATVHGNGSKVSGIDTTLLPKLEQATEARVLWQTGTSATTGLVVDPASVKFRNGRVKFSLGTALEGNAVIGLFASSNPEAPCIWSWHIWRVDGALPADVACVKDPSPTGASKNFKMMALNLGAFNNTPGSPKSIGLMYQWGRKDPFPNADGFTAKEPTNIYGSYNNNGTVGTWNGTYSIQTAASDGTIGTEAWAVQYPGVFITNSASSGDWMSTKNDNLWGTPWVNGGVTIGSDTYNNNQGVKSIYDPCPVGYRVPPQDTWNQAVKGTWNNGNSLTGIVSSGSFYFPASGSRRRESGAFGYVGAAGYSWSSSSAGAGSIWASYLNVTSAYVNPMDLSYRSYAHAVRCVQE